MYDMPSGKDVKMRKPGSLAEEDKQMHHVD